MQFITISIIAVITSQVNAHDYSGDITGEICESSNASELIATQLIKISLGSNWFICIISVAVLLAGCFGNFFVIYSLGIRKEKVTKLNLFISTNTSIVIICL